MDALEKLETLGRSAQYDLCGHCGGDDEKRVHSNLDRWIYPAALPDGRKIKLLKVLQTNACRNDCRYCGTRCSRDFRRVTLVPEELAAVFDQMRRQRRVSGLFLSSGIRGTADETMGRMAATVELLRRKYAFQGYVHLKVLPGASQAAMETAARLADRISINIEAPNANRLAVIAPAKNYETDLLARLRYLSSLTRKRDLRARSATTQFVVGAAGESDKEIVSRVWELYGDDGLNRAYYSAYQPPDDDALPSSLHVPLIREHRLYQVDFLFRRYRFSVADIAYDANGNLPLETDPKTVWAERRPEWFPMEVNTASREELLRVPGIGPVCADRIVEQRPTQRLRDIRDLARLGAATRRAAPYLLFNGRRPRVERQTHLWETSAGPAARP